MTASTRVLKSPGDLIAANIAAESDRAMLNRVTARYAMAITPSIAALIDPADPNDPIARQFVPGPRELETHPSEIADPIGDHLKSPAPGIVHRYPDRVLLKIASVCPVYCRFCFRREMVGPDKGEALSDADLAAALAYIAARPEIWEVILTGGDPLILSPRRIRSLSEQLAAIPHVKILRWHTRVPLVDPGRITPGMVAALRAASGGATVYLGLHVNHARELTAEARSAVATLIDAGIPVVSQTVLLKGVNDDVASLETLLRTLIEVRVKPYYLHHGDLAPGTAHFRVPIAKGRALMAGLRRRLSGLALPTYVLDLPGAHGKIPLESYSSEAAPGIWTVNDATGMPHIYQEVCAAPADTR